MPDRASPWILAAQFAVDRIADHLLADQRIAQVTTGVGHDHVAGLGHVQRLVNQEGVAGTRLGGNRRAARDTPVAHQPRRGATGKPLKFSTTSASTLRVRSRTWKPITETP